MRPEAKFHGFHELQSTKKVIINGPRPSPLMINKDSHLIRKPSVSSTFVVADHTKLHKQQQRQPIIIYTQSPKVIHTKPQDFMALVQRLTGKSSSKQDAAAATTSSQLHHHQIQTHHEASENLGSSSLSDGSNNSSIHQMRWKKGGGGACDVDETSSALRRDVDDDDEACVKGGASTVIQYSPFSLGLADMPLFTPNSSDFFCSSRSVMFKDSDLPYGILGSLISPSGLEFIKELPEY